MPTIPKAEYTAMGYGLESDGVYYPQSDWRNNAARFICEVGYKPGFRLKCRPVVCYCHAQDALQVHVSMEVPDARRTSARIDWDAVKFKEREDFPNLSIDLEGAYVDGRPKVVVQMAVFLHEDEARDLPTWVTDLVTELEHHERDEWLTFGGIRARDPHAPLTLAPPVAA